MAPCINRHDGPKKRINMNESLWVDAFASVVHLCCPWKSDGLVAWGFGSYKIVVDEDLEESIELLGGKMTFGDFDLCDVID